MSAMNMFIDSAVPYLVGGLLKLLVDGLWNSSNYINIPVVLARG